MRLTVLGSSASYADAGRATAGYLVEHDGTRVLLDCGHGVLANLARVADPLTLDGVFITHGHPDHLVDLYALQALLRYAPEGPAEAMRLWGPPGLLERMAGLLSPDGGRELLAAFEPGGLAPGTTVSLRGMHVTAHGARHGEDAFALTVETEEGRLFYTGDSAPAAEVAVAAKDADVLLAEATLPEAYAGAAKHMTATEAASLASEAGVRKLVLTHLWPTVDRASVARLVGPFFEGEVLVAEELMEIAVG